MLEYIAYKQWNLPLLEARGIELMSVILEGESVDTRGLGADLRIGDA